MLQKESTPSELQANAYEPIERGSHIVMKPPWTEVRDI